MPSALQKEKILALTKNQVGDSSNETDIDKDKEKLNELLPAKKNENYNTHLEEKNKVKDMDEELNEQPKNQVLKSASISKNKKKKKEFVNQPNTHDSHSAFVDAAIQGLKGKNKTIFSQNKEDMIGEDSLNQKTESPELSNKKDNFLPLQSNKKNIRANYFSNRSLLHNQNFKEKQLIQKFDDNESNILKVKETLINTADDFKDVNEIYTEKAPVDSSKLSTKYNSSKSKSPLNTDLSIPLSVLYEDNSKNSEILETSEKLKETFSKSQFNLKDSELGKKADQGKANGSNAFEDNFPRNFIESKPKSVKNSKKGSKHKGGLGNSKKKLNKNHSESELKSDTDTKKPSDVQNLVSSSIVNKHFVNKLIDENVTKPEINSKHNTNLGQKIINAIAESSVPKETTNSSFVKGNNKSFPKIKFVSLDSNKKAEQEISKLFYDATILLGDKRAIDLVLQRFPKVVNSFIITLIQKILVVKEDSDKEAIEDVFHTIEHAASEEPQNLHTAIKWLRNSISDSEELIEKEKYFNKMFFNWLVRKKNQENSGKNFIEKLQEIVKSHPLYYGN
ncbi:hypothetical protein BY996DRAFT_3715177 [Phakopsora pachyrhizi]|nr:hypothetical protein BY996DRAFT_3715177 [Phakopsora pachyrhizi]